MRLVLGVDMGLVILDLLAPGSFANKNFEVFELVGSFILSQTNYHGYDFKTHKEAAAIVEIGTLGGIAMGIALIFYDILTINMENINEGGDMQPRPGRGTAPRYANHESGARSHALIRAILWAGLAAGSGVVGTLLW